LDLFKLGMRNLFGIVLPGATLLLVLSFALFTATMALDWSWPRSSWMADSQTLTLIVLFLLSYLLGSVLRLVSVEPLDKKSGRLLQRRYLRRRRQASKKTTTEGSSQVLEQLRKEDGDPWKEFLPNPQYGGGDWDVLGSWEDRFIYPSWQSWRMRLFRPKEVYRFFFGHYKDCMQKRLGGPSFLNYCKTVIYDAGQKAGDLLVAEVQSLEAEVRFFAGTYYALLIGEWITAISVLIQVATQIARPLYAGKSLFPLRWGAPTLCFTFLLLIAMFVMDWVMLMRFRTLRMKEADTVLDAFYLVHRHTEQCPICSANEPKRTAQS